VHIYRQKSTADEEFLDCRQLVHTISGIAQLVENEMFPDAFLHDAQRGTGESGQWITITLPFAPPARAPRFLSASEASYVHKQIT
jgi:hypothetical protein